MAGKSKTRYAILGMLSIHPQSGYDIKKKIEEGLSIFWNESYGQIYKSLKNLVREKLVSKEHLKQKGKPNKDIYTITESGREELKQYLLMPTEKLTVRDEFTLKFFLGFNVPIEMTKKLVEAEIEKVTNQIRHIEEKREDPDCAPTDEYIKFYLDHMGEMGLTFFQEKIKWCKEAIKKLEEIEKLKNNQ